MPIAFVAGTEEEIKAGKGKLLLTATQAAARVGINERRLRQLVDKDEITPYEEKVCNMPLFLLEDVEALRQSRLKRF